MRINPKLKATKMLTVSQKAQKYKDILGKIGGRPYGAGFWKEVTRTIADEHETFKVAERKFNPTPDRLRKHFSM